MAALDFRKNVIFREKRDFLFFSASVVGTVENLPFFASGGPFFKSGAPYSQGQTGAKGRVANSKYIRKVAYKGGRRGPRRTRVSRYGYDSR